MIRNPSYPFRDRRGNTIRGRRTGYWSSTLYDSNNAWNAKFDNGNGNNNNVNNARCVRGGP